MPKRRKGEKLSKYVSRCVKVRQREGKDTSVRQSVAVCYSMGGEGGKRKYKGRKKSKKRR